MGAVRPRVLVGLAKLHWTVARTVRTLALLLASRYDFDIRRWNAFTGVQGDLALACWWGGVGEMREGAKARRWLLGVFEEFSWRGDPGREKRFAEACAQTSGVIVPCALFREHILECLSAHGVEVPVAVCEEGVDTALFVPQPVPQAFTAGWAGILRDAAFAELKGIGILRDACERAGVPLRVADYMRESVPHEKMPEWYKSISVYLCASSSESTCAPLLEAMASGRPVISTRVGLAPQLIEEGVTGYLSERTPEAFAEALRRVRTLDRGIAAKAARKRAEEHAWTRKAAGWATALSAPLVRRPVRPVTPALPVHVASPVVAPAPVSAPPLHDPASSAQSAPSTFKVVMVGNFDPPHSSENDWAWTLRHLGHEVIQLQENRITAEEVGDRVRREQADLFWWTRTWGLQGNGHRMLRELPCPSIAYHLDLWAPLPRGGHVDTDPWWRCDIVFSPDGGSDAFWRLHGVNHVYMRPGVVERDCLLTPPDEERRCDVLFVGSYHYHPEWPYRPQLIDWLRATYGNRFAHWGGSPDRSVRGYALNRLYAASKVVVGDSFVPGFTHERYWSDRVYETIGRGGFIVHPQIAGLGEELRDGEHLAYYRFGDFDGLRATVDRYLDNDDERERVRRMGHEHVRACCTYTQRVREALHLAETRL